MLELLRNINILCNESMYKPELYHVIKFTKPNYKQFYIDSILEQYGHNVLILSPYHPELNPIELIWGKGKNNIMAHNLSNQLNVVHEMVKRN